MGKKRLILIHGRAVKPAEKPMKSLARKAVAEGLRRAGATADAKALTDGSLAFDLVYFGDFINAIQSAARKKDQKLLTATDPDHGGAACFPIADLETAFADVSKLASFSKARYADLLKTADDYKFLDEFADFTSTLGSLFTFGWLNDKLIQSATPDLFAYLTQHTTGSLIRQRLAERLRPALEKKEDICLIAHSMGAMVSYDEFWKYSHESAFDDSPYHGTPVSLFLTIGCPLGEEGVRRNLLDGRYHSLNDKYPRGQIGTWHNIYAQDDYVSHAESMRAAFAEMRNKKYLDTIIDSHIYNCWSYADSHSGRRVSNPHDLYGYLMHQTVGAAVSKWLAA
jgi:hypothetical protein